MRLFNPNTMTEAIPGFHDTAGAIELPADNWFFRTSEIPKGMRLDVNDKGEPVLLEIENEMTEKGEVDAI